MKILDLELQNGQFVSQTFQEELAAAGVEAEIILVDRRLSFTPDYEGLYEGEMEILSSFVSEQLPDIIFIANNQGAGTSRVLAIPEDLRSRIVMMGLKWNEDRTAPLQQLGVKHFVQRVDSFSWFKEKAAAIANAIE
jgi:hypothetical protein